MPKIEPFEKYSREYEAWFSDHPFVYESEILAVRTQLPRRGEGIEVGVGSARFAAPLGIRLGVEPSAKMRELARARGVTAIGATAEMLPFLDCRFDYVLMVTAMCFFDDTEKALMEARRVLKPNGQLIIGFIDKESPVGKIYENRRNESLFYKTANFEHLNFVQTIFRGASEIKSIEPVKQGYGEGSFVVVRASKPRDNRNRRIAQGPKVASAVTTNRPGHKSHVFCVERRSFRLGNLNMRLKGTLLASRGTWKRIC
jgi:SAM-dependent methyltransferase